MKRPLIAGLCLLVAILTTTACNSNKTAEVEVVKSTTRPASWPERFGLELDITAPEKHKEAIEEDPKALHHTEEEIIMIAKVIYNESGAIRSLTEQACVAWTILNHCDAFGVSISEAIVPGRFAYASDTPTYDSFGRDLVALAQDVVDRWEREKTGEMDVGRVLPSDYLYYHGDGRHNYFRNEYSGGTRWNYSLPSPYES